VVRGSAQPLSRSRRPRAAVTGHAGAVIAETGIRYHRPLVYADEILVTARTVRLGHTSFEMEYAVWRDGLCALGRAVLILVVNATGEKTPLPLDLRERILARDPDAQGEVRYEKRRHRHLRQPQGGPDHAA
jgi:acyl-CoA thioesterase FadM